PALLRGRPTLGLDRARRRLDAGVGRQYPGDQRLPHARRATGSDRHGHDHRALRLLPRADRLEPADRPARPAHVTARAVLGGHWTLRAGGGLYLVLAGEGTAAAGPPVPALPRPHGVSGVPRAAR